MPPNGATLWPASPRRHRPSGLRPHDLGNVGCTNNAAAALAFPIAYATAQTLGVNFLPFAVVIAIAASAGFATPLGYQTHLMVYGAGGYRFNDYLRIGIPLDVIAMVVTVILTPWFFPLQ